MSLLFRVIYASHCRGTHHKLAMDALKRLECPHADRWRRLMLKHHDAYLLGSKAPDTRFKDFYNHVLHVDQDDWGGAPETARLWFHRTVETLKKRHWVNGVYAAGALSHYYTDPIQPFHTGQSQAENNIHRALEWSISQSYDQLWAIAEQIGLPEVDPPVGENWLEDLVKQGAEFSHPHYQTLIDHYDFEQGRNDPPAGLDDFSREILAKLLGYAVVGWSRILDRVFIETDLAPPRVSLAIPSIRATWEIPLQTVARKLSNVGDRAKVRAMYEELQIAGKVEEHLPEDDRAVRDMFYEDWAEAAPADYTAPPESTSESNQPAAEEDSSDESLFHLDLKDRVEEAPSIGSKTARRLKKLKIRFVRDLLEADPEESAQRLRAEHITPDVIRDWQDQARLVCRVPKLRGGDAQVLVACGYRDPLDISTAPTGDLLNAAIDFAETREGQRVIRSGKTPDESEITNWQSWAGQARELKAA